MNSSVMIDSSMLVEYLKTTKMLLLDSLLEDDTRTCFINETVVSEYLFQYLKVTTGKAPKTLESAGRVPSILMANDNYLLLNGFKFLQTTADLFFLVPTFMQQYNLLPNDAIILATCKIHGITQLATHDSDFDIAALAEGIQLLKEDSQLIMDN